ncbi:Uncharacterised protein [uncultured archaeon]|nr:Uncharacterised protein [uncultured archaeon]
MVKQKLGLILLAFVAVVAIGGFTVQLRDTVTGDYTATNVGRWYAGAQKAQMQPDEACTYSGLEPMYPWQVYTNEYGTFMSLCKKDGYYVGVPLVQTVIVP